MAAVALILAGAVFAGLADIAGGLAVAAITGVRGGIDAFTVTQGEITGTSYFLALAGSVAFITLLTCTAMQISIATVGSCPVSALIALLETGFGSTGAFTQTACSITCLAGSCTVVRAVTSAAVVPTAFAGAVGHTTTIGFTACQVFAATVAHCLKVGDVSAIIQPVQL